MTTIAINEKTAKGKLLLSMIEPFKGQSFITFFDENKKPTLSDIAKKLDASILPNNVSDEEIMDEIKRFRDEK